MKKLRYERVMIMFLSVLMIVLICCCWLMGRSQIYEYNGEIKTYVGSYRQDDKTYTFDLKAFVLEDEYYVSLNDMYNMIVILDDQARVYLDYDKHLMTFQMSDMTYEFDYGHDRMNTQNECIDFKENDTHIYISHKNIYLSVSFIEKILLNNQKSIQFKNANAIIE